MKTTATATFLLAAFLANPENKQTFVQFNSQEEFDRIVGIIKAEKLDQFDTKSPILTKIPSFPLYVGFGLGYGTNLPSLVSGQIIPSEILVANEPHPQCCTPQEPKQVLKSVEITTDLYESLLIDALGLNPAHVKESLLLLLNKEKTKLEEQQAIIDEWHQESVTISQKVEALIELRKLKYQA